MRTRVTEKRHGISGLLSRLGDDREDCYGPLLLLLMMMMMMMTVMLMIVMGSIVGNDTHKVHCGAPTP